MNAVGVTVGATKIAAGVVSPEGELLDEVRRPTADTRAIGRRANEVAVENPDSVLGRIAAERGLAGEDVLEV